MSNWIHDHLATCFFITIGLMCFLSIIFSHGLNKANQKYDDITFQYDSIIELELKGHELLNKIVIEDSIKNKSNGRKGI
jgi:hypothetical protein